MNSQSVLAGLFSRITVVLLFSVVGVLLSASFYTYLQDRKLQSVSLSALRMASWNLVRLGSEASAWIGSCRCLIAVWASLIRLP